MQYTSNLVATLLRIWIFKLFVKGGGKGGSVIIIFFQQFSILQTVVVAVMHADALSWIHLS